MLTKEQFEHLANRLIAKTNAGQVIWQVGQEFTADNTILGREFDVQFPTSILSVGYFSPISDSEYILLTVTDNQGAVLYQRRIALGSAEWELAVRVCTTAYNAVFGADKLDDILRLLDSDQSIGQPSKSSEVFSIIKGKWHLTYTWQGKPGAEDAIIDGEGNYYLATAPSLKYFRLVDAEANLETRQVRFTKVSASGPSAGRPHDTEILTLSPDGSTMEGLSAGYGHGIKYVRVPSWNISAAERSIIHL